jgi:Tol biopolymer transport system component/tRNA A-37 threonylcarbamoyl transferase component Bud32
LFQPATSYIRSPVFFAFQSGVNVSLSIGTRLGTVEVLAVIGRGGMGEVYRARDTKLKRDVAIKTLPDEFLHDADRLSRFQREAEVLASLNHPNIAAIYDLQEAEGSRFLVLELVEGETLADRIARGPIPIDEALQIAMSICEALQAAHEQGIVHRDLKPANIKITPDGKVKVLDFGLAKAMEHSPTTTLSNSPTLLSAAASNAGVILGTAAYMSPEQASGKNVDKRSDLWAFGVVLLEMLTGRAVFEGETVSHVLAAVLTKEPDWNALPAKTSAPTRRLLRRCLEKDRKRRMADAGDVRLEIEEGLTAPATVGAGHIAHAGTNRRLWVAFLLSLFAALGLALVYLREAPPATLPETRLDVTTPPTDDLFSFAISPDGRRLVFAASKDGKPQLWVRSLDSVVPQPLAGTEDAFYPFWSPDSASVGFFANAKLKRVDIAGGAPRIITNAANGRGGSWNRQGIIIYSPGAAAPLFTVSATGGEPTAVTHLETGETGHRFPQFLPDGHHFIYFVLGPQSVYAGSLEGSPPKRILSSDAAAVISPLGFVLFPRLTTLFEQAFDFGKLEIAGNPVALAEQLAYDPAVGAPGYSAGSHVVTYRTGAAVVSRQLTWLDRSGKVIGSVGPPDSTNLTNVSLSPDGKRVAVSRTSSGNSDVWLVDTSRGVPTRFTFDAASEAEPAWSPDGSKVVFQSNRSGGAFNLYAKASSGAGNEDLLLQSDQSKAPNSWTPDGRFLLFRSTDPKTGMDLWVLPLAGDKKPFPFLKTAFEERDGEFSPDGKWVAYQSNESGKYEIYVQPFPGPGGKFQVSTNGGTQPRWNKNGKEIFYISLDSKMTAVAVKRSPDNQSLETGTLLTLFPVRIAMGPSASFQKQQYDVSSDGLRFLVNLAAEEGVTSPITLISNWHPPKP